LSSSPQVFEGLTRVQGRYEVLVGRAAGRRATLQQQQRVHVFQREAKDLLAWLTSRMTLAESQDCGQHLETMEVRGHMTWSHDML